MMNKLYVALAAIPALAAATPAAGQYLDRVDAGIDNRISQLQTRLRTGLEEGKISRGEAQPLRAQLRELTLMERAYRSDGGFSRKEQAELRQLMRKLGRQIDLADRGRSSRDARRGG